MLALFWKVCSKGCNRMLKVQKPKPAASSSAFLTDSDLFDIVVCQVDWRIICSPQKPGITPHCETTKAVQPMARCAFSNKLWNSGPTCIAHHVHADAHPQCPPTLAASVPAHIKKSCRKYNATSTTERGARLGEALGVRGGAGRRSGGAVLATTGEARTTDSANK
jgi:hypothetical protein